MVVVVEVVALPLIIHVSIALHESTEIESKLLV